jgi:hypothetical protein
MSPLKQELLTAIEAAPDEELEQLLNLLKTLRQKPTVQPTQNIVDFFRQSPLAEVVATGELDLSRDKSTYVDRFFL